MAIRPSSTGLSITELLRYKASPFMEKKAVVCGAFRQDGMARSPFPPGRYALVKLCASKRWPPIDQESGCLPSMT